jgi:repressor LexA
MADGGIVVYMKKPLTYKQHQVINELKDYIGKNGEAPTLEELREKLRVQSLRTVTQYLDALEEKGYISRRKFARRNIELRDANESGAVARMISIPVLANVGCDDLSVFAQEAVHDEFLEVDSKLAQEEDGGIVAVRAVGDSMLDAGIHSGDYVLIRFTDHAENGDRVAAIVGDMVTVKRLERREGVTILYPENKDPKYKPIVLREDFKIAGKVLCVIPNPGAVLTEVVPL